MAFNPLGLGMQQVGPALGGLVYYTSIDDTASQITADDYFKVNAAEGSAGYRAEKDAIDSLKAFIRKQQGVASNRPSPPTEYGVMLFARGNNTGANAVVIRRLYIDESVAGDPIKTTT